MLPLSFFNIWPQKEENLFLFHNVMCILKYLHVCVCVCVIFSSNNRQTPFFIVAPLSLTHTLMGESHLVWREYVCVVSKVSKFH